MRWYPTVALILAATACETRGSDDEANDAPVIRDSSGVRIVDNSDVDPAGIPHWSIDTTPSVTIGTTAGDPAHEFGSVSGVRQLPNGMIVLLTGQGEAAFEFRFFDSTGKHIATHGRRGQGPGEYRWVNFFGTTGGDTLIAVDFPNKRLNWLSVSQGYLRSVMLDETAFKKVLGDDASGLVELMVPLGDSLYAIHAFRETPGTGGQLQSGRSFHLLDLEAGKSVDLLRHDDPPAKQIQLSTGPSVVWPVNAPSPSHVVDRERGRICAGVSSTPEISCVDTAGRRIRMRWRAEMVPYTADDRRLYEERLRNSRRGSRFGAPQDLEKIIAAAEFPERHNAFTALQTDTEGNFWILEYTLDASGARKSRFRVLDPEGRHVAFADAFPIRTFGHDATVHIGERAVARRFENADGAEIIGLFTIRRQN
jgi:hypothetical protein